MKRIIQSFVVVLFALSLIPSDLLSRSFTIPRANFIITPTVGESDQPITFDASDSFSADGGRNLQYRWKFTPKDDWTGFSGSSVQKFTTGRTGNFRAQLQIKDTVTGITQNTYRTYRVGSPIPRRAHMYVTPLNPQYGEPVNFRVDVFKVRNEDIDDIQVRWDFDGDGTFDTGFSSTKEAESVFGPNQVRTFRPVAEVRFKDGDIFTVDRITPSERTNVSREDFFNSSNTKDTPKIEVRSGGVKAPILDVSPGSYGPHPETQFIFDSTRSVVPRGGWTEWSFDNSPFEKGPRFLRKQFDTPGEHNVRVRTCVGVTQRLCGESEATFEIKERGPQFLVTTSVQSIGTQSLDKSSNGEYSGSIGQSINLSANTRSIDGRSIPSVEYRWDTDGDGDFDTPFTSRSSIRVSLDDEQAYEFKVEAKSRDGFVADDSVVVNVAGNTPPTGKFQVRSQKINDGFLVTFTPQVSDAESSSSNLKTRFDLDGDGNFDTQFSTPRSVQWKYLDPGTYEIQMQIRDENGATAFSKALIVVQDPNGNKPIGFQEIIQADEEAFPTDRIGNWIPTKKEPETPEPQEPVVPESNPENQNSEPAQNTSSTPPVEINPPAEPPLPEENKSVEQVENQFIETPQAQQQNVEYTEYIPNPGYGPLQTPPTFEIHKAFNRFLTGESNSNSGSAGSLGIQPIGGNSYVPNPNLPINQSPSPQSSQTSGASGSGDSSQGSGGTAQGGNSENQASSGTQNRSSSQEPVPAKIKELQEQYAGQAIEPAYPGENPFTDISEDDPYFPYAIQAYRDGIVNGPVFFGS